MMTSTRQPRPRWPELELIGRRPLFIALQAPDKPHLVPLICKGWEVRQNPEFNYYMFDLVPETHDLAEKWRRAFGRLGQDREIIVITTRFDVRLYRPVCTWLDEKRIYFHNLNRLVEPVDVKIRNLNND